MKKLALLVPILAAVAFFSQPVYADVAKQPEKVSQAVPEAIAVQAEKMNDPESVMLESISKMQAQMVKINQTKDSKKRLKLLQEHSKSMRDSIKVMREMMMGGMSMGCPMGSGHMMGNNPDSLSADKADAAPVAQAKTEQTATSDKTSTNPDKKLWTCPMHPNIVQDQPGTCPICGMDLVEKGQPGAPQTGHDHAMGGCMMGGGMKDGCMMGGGMKGGMKDGCMMGGGMKGGMKDGCMMGGGMKGGCMMGQMMKMSGMHMDMMLILMEQMIEHDEAEMAVRK